jgi:MFS family permease
VTGYFLAQAAIIPVVGYLSDRIGSKSVFLTALALFTMSSALCAFAPTEEWLILFRVVQGIGGGALLPIAFAIVYRIFPPTERDQATALIGVSLLLAPAFGPTVGGYLSTAFDWRAIFIINLPIGIAAFLLASLILRGPSQERNASGGERPEKKSFDYWFTACGSVHARLYTARNREHGTFTPGLAHPAQIRAGSGQYPAADACTLCSKQ